MKKYIQGIFLITFSILLSRTESAGQINEEVKYCQIYASASYKKDLEVEHFLLGRKYEKTADSLFAVCKTKLAFENKGGLYLTDALNFFYALGWKLVTVYPVLAVNPDFSRYYYVLKRE
jgi:hypothetical protein